MAQSSRERLPHATARRYLPDSHLTGVSATTFHGLGTFPAYFHPPKSSGALLTDIVGYLPKSSETQISGYLPEETAGCVAPTGRREHIEYLQVGQRYVDHTKEMTARATSNSPTPTVNRYRTHRCVRQRQPGRRTRVRRHKRVGQWQSEQILRLP